MIAQAEAELKIMLEEQTKLQMREKKIAMQLKRTQELHDKTKKEVEIVQEKTLIKIAPLKYSRRGQITRGWSSVRTKSRK